MKPTDKQLELFIGLYLRLFHRKVIAGVKTPIADKEARKEASTAVFGSGTGEN